MRIGCLSLGQREFTYGLRLLEHQLVGAGYDVKWLDESANLADFDVLLISVYWWEHVYDLAQLLREAGINPAERKPVVVVGGTTPSQNPRVFAKFATYVFVGEGEDQVVPLVRAIENGDDVEDVPGVWSPRKEGRVVLQETPLVTAAPYVLQGKTKITQVEIMRGCPFRCRFCAISHLHSYRTLPFSSAKRAVFRATTKGVALTATEKSAYPKVRELREICDKYGKEDTSQDYRIEHLVKLKRAERIRWALEGLSPRLRYAVGKRYPDDKVIEWLRIIEAMPSRTKPKHNFCLTYMILDLPGEDLVDYQAFEALLHRAGDEALSDTFAWKLVPNSFLPQPMTGLQWAGIRTDRDHAALWRGMAWNEDGSPKSFGFRAVLNASVASPAKRLLSHLVYRGDENAASTVIWNLANNKLMRRMVRLRQFDRILRVCNKAGLSSDWLLGQIALDSDLPWDVVDNPNAPKEALVKEWRAYWKAMGKEEAPTAGAYWPGNRGDKR